MKKKDKLVSKTEDAFAWIDKHKWLCILAMTFLSAVIKLFTAKANLKTAKIEKKLYEGKASK